MQLSIGGSSGGAAVVRTSSDNAPRSPYDASAVIRRCPAWLSSAPTVATLPPSRITFVVTWAGPGVLAPT